MRSEEQISVDIVVAQKNKSYDAAQKTVSVDTAQENKAVDVALMNKPAENMPINKAADEKNKVKVHADAIVASQEGVFGKSFVASKPVEKTSSISEAVAKKSADLKNGTESVKNILNDEKKATDVKVASGDTKETSEVEVKGAQAVEEIMNVDQLTSLIKEALDIKKEVGEVKDKASSAVTVEVKVPLATPEVSSLTKKVDFSPTDDEVAIVKEVVVKKFGDMTLSDYNSEEDDDYSLSEAETEDSLEWASETERTKAEDDLA